MVSIEFDTYVALGRAQQQHDAILARLYRDGVRRQLDLGDIARDDEVIYNLEVVEAISEYIHANS